MCNGEKLDKDHQHDSEKVMSKLFTMQTMWYYSLVIARQMCQSRLSLLISHWVHKKDLDFSLSMIGSKEIIWKISFVDIL